MSAALRLPALTIWQPWASLILAKAKPYEFRGHAAPRFVRNRRIAIHAGARPVRRAELADLILRLRGRESWTTALDRDIALPLLERWHTAPLMLPLAHVLCTAVLGEPVDARTVVGAFGGGANDSDREAHFNLAWPLGAIESCEPPVPARGAQGFWWWTP